MRVLGLERFDPFNSAGVHRLVMLRLTLEGDVFASGEQNVLKVKWRRDSIGSRQKGVVTGAGVGGVAGAAITGGSVLGTVGGAAIGGVVGDQIGKRQK